MKRFLKLYVIEQKLALRSADMLIFGVAMPVGIMILINMIAGQKQAAEGFTYLESSFASLIAVGICAAAFMGIPLTIADYRDKKILKHFFTTLLAISNPDIRKRIYWWKSVRQSQRKNRIWGV